MPEDYSLIGWVLAFFGVASWLAGSHTFFGQPMEIRTGAFWVACRWLGVGILLPSIFSGGSVLYSGSIFTAIGGAAIALGSSRRLTRRRDAGVLPPGAEPAGESPKPSK